MKSSRLELERLSEASILVLLVMKCWGEKGLSVPLLFKLSKRLLMFINLSIRCLALSHVVRWSKIALLFVSLFACSEFSFYPFPL